MGDWNRDSAVISVNEGLGPEIGGWSTTISFSTTRYHHTSVVHNGYLYVIGGYGGNSLNDVQYAPINSDGTLGTWNTTTPFTGGRGSHASVVHNGYLYVIGGYENMTDNHLNDVQYAPINADGTVGSWNTTTSFATARHGHTSVVHNGYLYVKGGHSGSAPLSDVQYAPINADGTVGSWNTTTSFATARQGHTGVVHNGYLYVIGGYDISNFFNDVQYAPINADGTVGGWSTTTSFTNVRQGHTSVVHNGHLYVIGGHDQSSGSSVFLNDVQYAPISADGTVGSWSTTISFATARHAHTSVVYNEYLYLIGGYDESSRFNDVQYAPFVP